METKHIKHLYRRIGFGILPEDLKKLSKKSKKDIVNALFKASKTATVLEIDTSKIKALAEDSISSGSRLDAETRRMIQKLSRKKQVDLNNAWVDRLANTDQVIREKMTLFWANHFECKDNNIVYIQQFNNTLRANALGNFESFVNAVSKEAAMTKYLNTKQNKKQKPNENFARELMELFTLGVGHYTETDIKESARAFTGYSHDIEGNFVFKKRQHDNCLKTFMGKTGDFSGQAIVNIILSKKACATYICTKVYRYFVNDNVNEAHVNQMADVFYKDYNIEALMKFTLMSDWFYDDVNIGSKIKSPIEFIVGIKTLVPVTFKRKKQLLIMQRLLGQTLLDPPNVAGWKGGKNWIDSNTITLRLKLPALILNSGYISNAPVGTSEEKMALKKLQTEKRNNKRFQAIINWSHFEEQFKNVTMEAMTSHILACELNKGTKAYIASLEKASKQEYCIQLMSLPEYQMC